MSSFSSLLRVARIELRFSYLFARLEGEQPTSAVISATIEYNPDKGLSLVLSQVALAAALVGLP